MILSVIGVGIVVELGLMTVVVVSLGLSLAVIWAVVSLVVVGVVWGVVSRLRCRVVSYGMAGRTLVMWI